MKKKLFASVFAAGALLLMASCGASRNAASVTALNGEWNVVEAGGQNTVKSQNDEQPFMGFEVKSNKMYGSSGCNRMFGSLNADARKGTMSFGGVGSTRMMCADMTTERLVLDAVNKVAGYELQKDGSLLLKDKDGNKLMVLRKK